MGLVVVRDSNGLPRIEFRLLLDALGRVGGKFDSDLLSVVPYEQLVLCAAAGDAACPPEAVLEEKAARRARFLRCPSDRLEEAARYLEVESMRADVLRAVEERGWPAWESLTGRQKVWFKLACLGNHLDNPFPRLAEAIALLDEAARSGGFPPKAARRFTNSTLGLLSAYPEYMKDADLRSHVGSHAEELLAWLPEEEKRACLAGRLRDYRCTSDCHR